VVSKLDKPLKRKDNPICAHSSPMPDGAMCTHQRMRRKKCAYCTKSCQLECPDCGFIWLYEWDYRP
jgi:hypothetical protein